MIFIPRRWRSRNMIHIFRQTRDQACKKQLETNKKTQNKIYGFATSHLPNCLGALRWDVKLPLEGWSDKLERNIFKATKYSRQNRRFSGPDAKRNAQRALRAPPHYTACTAAGKPMHRHSVRDPRVSSYGDSLSLCSLAADVLTCEGSVSCVRESVSCRRYAYVAINMLRCGSMKFTFIYTVVGLVFET